MLLVKMKRKQLKLPHFLSRTSFKNSGVKCYSTFIVNWFRGDDWQKTGNDIPGFLFSDEEGFQ
jgi:hypothetical protein